MTKGWKLLINNPKAHYFIDGRSLCGRWMNLGKDFEDFGHHSPDNCKACMKKRDAMEGERKYPNDVVEEERRTRPNHQYDGGFIGDEAERTLALEALKVNFKKKKESKS